jgi:two-component system sensor histidine kinase VicK
MNSQTISKYNFLQGGGEMGELIRSYDWSNSSLGEPSDWPNSLKVMVGVMLASTFPMHITWGPKFIQLYNDGYQPILGNIKHPKALGLPIYDSYPEIWDTVGPMFHGVMDGKAVHFHDFQLFLDRNGNKEECYFDFSYSPIKNEQGVIEGVLTNVIETTNRKLAELENQNLAEKLQSINEELSATNEELAASNEELRSTNEELAQANDEILVGRQKIEEGETALRLAINAADFGTWFIHSGTREFITDSRLKELFGYYPDEPLSIEQAIAQITEEYRGYVAEKLENAIYNNGDYDVTYSVIGLHDDRLRWLRAIGNLKVDPSGAFSAFTGVVMDITEQVEAKNTLEKAYEQLRLSKEAAQLGFFDLDLTKGTMVWDSRCRELFGISHNGTVTYEKDFITGLHAEDKERILAVINNVFIKSVTGGIYDVEYRTVGAEDQQLRWVRAKGQVYFDQENKPVRFIGSVLNITEQKEDEQRKNDFIGMVSHELKTPLTSLTGVLQLAERRLKSNDDTFLASAMEKANVQVKRMSNMINSFLNVSRLESAKLLIDKHEFDLQELIEEIVIETKLTVSSHTIKLQNLNSIMVNADRDKINSVLTNLISNAVKYSPEGKIIEVGSIVTEDSVHVSIKDEGIGLSPQDIDKVFDRYFRVENKHTNLISGFGIGLYLSAEIIHRHNGKIWVKSESSKGSTFYFSLPLKNNA